MTFSIVARSADGESWGIAVASRFFAVGSVVPAASAGVGAVATQAWCNLDYKAAALAQMGEGAPATEVLRRLIDGDEGRESRQVGIVDRTGRAASFTGPSCMDWAGGVTGEGYAIQGNILVGEEVVLAMQAAFEASDPASPLRHRLTTALRAGDDAGGDARGRQSASLLVVKDAAGFDGQDDIQVDIRVDDHSHPIDELERVLGVYERMNVEVPDDQRTPDSPELFAELDSRAQALGFSSALMWIYDKGYEGYGGSDWTGTRVVDELREATPDWQPET